MLLQRILANTPWKALSGSLLRCAVGLRWEFSFNRGAPQSASWSVWRSATAARRQFIGLTERTTVLCPPWHLNLGLWLPQWAAPWETARVSFASVKVWQYDDPGDVQGVLIDDIPKNFDAEGRPLR